MIARDDTGHVNLNLDSERLLAIVSLSYDTVADVTGVNPLRPKEAVLEEVKALLVHGVTLQLMLSLSSVRMNDLYLRVDPRKKKVLAISPRFPTLRNRINGMLRLL